MAKDMSEALFEKDGELDWGLPKLKTPDKSLGNIHLIDKMITMSFTLQCDTDS